MDVELFWAIVCNIVVIGGALLGGALFYFWFVTVPDRVEARRRTSTR
jgi:hypothetical protein